MLITILCIFLYKCYTQQTAERGDKRISRWNTEKAENKLCCAGNLMVKKKITLKIKQEQKKLQMSAKEVL